MTVPLTVSKFFNKVVSIRELEIVCQFYRDVASSHVLSSASLIDTMYVFTPEITEAVCKLSQALHEGCSLPGYSLEVLDQRWVFFSPRCYDLDRQKMANDMVAMDTAGHYTARKKGLVIFEHVFFSLSAAATKWKLQKESQRNDAF